MSQLRDPSTLLDNNEIEAIKICQGIISRMAENSVKTKNAFFVISAAFIALLGSDAINLTLPIILAYWVLALAMWYTDARYLQLEQMFRGVHARIVGGCQPNLQGWMFIPNKKDAKPVWRLMVFNFSTMIYPVAAMVMSLLACA